MKIKFNHNPKYQIKLCDICLGTGYYRDYVGVYHECPKCAWYNKKRRIGFIG